MSADEPAPKERRQTWREALRYELRGDAKTLRELSVALHAKEKDLLEHLVHLERSLERSEERLVITPARCLACGYEFDDRTRLSKPGRCPVCKATRIAPPRYAIEPA